MAAAVRAVNLGAGHEEGIVLGLADRTLDRLVEARPAGAGVEFRRGGEQRLVAAGAVERALPLFPVERAAAGRSEEHTSELQSLMRISYAVFWLKKKKIQ